MTKAYVKNRSYEILTEDDLAVLRDLSCEQRELFFSRNPHLKRAFKDRLIAIALCQGAAQHFVDRSTGVKNFDIWWFYPEHPTARYPHRARKEVYCSLPRFGTWRVDLMGRAIDSRIIRHYSGDPIACIREYLRQGRTETARLLARKAVVGLHPCTIYDKIIWPE